MFFDGYFDMGLYIHGTLYDPEGNKIYEGQFMNNIPKESKNIHLYEIEGNLKYISRKWKII